jgi:hypothetical protein
MTLLPLRRGSSRALSKQEQGLPKQNNIGAKQEELCRW